MILPLLILNSMLLIGQHPGGIGLVNNIGAHRSPPCASGSFSDNFAGTAGALTAHSTVYSDFNSYWNVGNAVLTGSSSVEPAHPYDVYGFVVSCSSSDTAQVTMVAHSSADTGIVKFVCVRAIPGTTAGYCASLAFGDGSGNYVRAVVFKNGSDVNESGLGSWAASSNHTVRISVSGTSSVHIQIWVDSTLMNDYTDSSSTISAPGNIAFYMSCNGVSGNCRVTNIQDY